MRIISNRRRYSSNLISFPILISLILGPHLGPSTNGNGAGPTFVQCSSSYIDDYFLPTAKIALNKIQQSFSPQQQQQPQTTTSATQDASQVDVARALPELQRQGESSANAPSRQDPVSSSSSPGDPPSESVSPEGRPDGTESGTQQRQQEATFDVSRESRRRPDETNADEEQRATVVSSTESVSEDPTTSSSSQAEDFSESTTAVASSGQDAREAGQQDKAQEATENSETAQAGSATTTAEAQPTPSSTTTTTTTTTSTSSEAAEVSELAVISNQIGDATLKPPSAESIRETELEAIAAVDASIGFGDSQLNVAAAAAAAGQDGITDACYDEYGNARYCEPEFENVAFERQVEVSSECGHPPSRFCTTYLNEHNDQIRNCHICDAQHPKKRHPASYLTDMNTNSNNPTCWVSAPISASTSLLSNNNNSGSSSDETAPGARDNVTLTLNLDKKYEITYVSMQFCSLKPDSLAIWRSADFGQSWSPYQFFSSQCARFYGLPMAGEQVATVRPQDADKPPVFEAACLNTTGQSSSGRVAFSTLDAIRTGNQSLQQAANPQTDKSVEGLHEWMTATNIRIILDRHQASWIQSSLAHHSHHRSNHQASVTGGKAQLEAVQQPLNATASALVATMENNAKQPAANGGSELETSLTSPSDTFNYALSDLTVGGRCKCNGHASRCVHNADGKLQCDCQHNTDGPDCERCLPLHHDRPWQRATQANANPCQPCNCNGHSRKCRFDAELYLLSGKRSGGVCIDCKDNTTGRHCHYCKEGHTRDHSKPMSDKGACKPCDCHPLGSVGKVCNQTTGQCPCKEGVTGLECNRCAPGYQQSSSPSEPCIRLPENDINYEPTIEVGDDQMNSIISHQASGDQEPSLVVPPPSSSSSSNDEQQLIRAEQQTSTRAPPARQQPHQGANGFRPPPTPQLADNDLTAGPTPTDENEDTGQLGGGGNPQLSAPGQVRSRHHDQQGRHRQAWQQMAADKVAHQRVNNYYAGKHRHRQQQQQFAAADIPPEEFADELELMRASAGGQAMRSQPDEPDDYQMNPHHQMYGIPTGNFYQDKRPQAMANFGSNPFRQQGRGRTPPMVNLDNEDQPSYATDEHLGGPYGGGQSADSMGPLGAIYPPPSNIDDSSFNQIQGSSGPLVHTARRMHAGAASHHHQLAGNGLRSRQQQGRRPTSGLVDPGLLMPLEGQHKQQVHQTMRQVPPANSLACADCQTGTRKMSFRQFCHLDFAIRATVLAKQMANDWTRFDVEIQDIFKSPTSSSLMLLAAGQETTSRNNPSKNLLGLGGRPVLSKSASPSGSSSSSYWSTLPYENGFQADDPGAQMMIANQNQTQKGVQDEQTNSGGGATAELPEQQQQQHPIHRLKIGNIQSIWIPTEDVACKCPRLKLRTSYLLMGLVDSKENSATSIQMDRHGVALEWKTSLQEKLIKYQRRHSRGRC